MKRLFASVVFILLIISCARTPEVIINAVFGLNLDGIEYQLITRDAYWLPNGDGECYIECKIRGGMDEIVDEMIGNMALPLPVQKSQCYHELLTKYSSSDMHGYYILNQHPPMMDFDLIIYDDQKHVLIIYYKIL